MENDEVRVPNDLADAFDEIDPLGDEDPRVEDRGMDDDKDIEEVMSVGGLLWGTSEDENIY